MTKAMKEANNLVAELSSKIEYLDGAIERLEAEVTTLEEQLETGSNKFDMAVVKQNKEIQHEITMTKQTIEEAKDEKRRAIEGSSADTFNKAQKILRDNQKEKRDLHKADNLEIIEHIEAIREKVKLIEEKDKEYTKEALDFLTELRPFLDKEPAGVLNTLAEVKYNKLWNTLHSSSRTNVLEFPNERQLGTTDVLKRPNVTVVEWTAKEKARFS